MSIKAYWFHCTSKPLPEEMLNHRPFNGKGMNHRRVKRRRLLNERYAFTHTLHEARNDAENALYFNSALWNLLDQTRDDMFSYVFKEKPTDVRHLRPEMD